MAENEAAKVERISVSYFDLSPEYRKAMRTEEEILARVFGLVSAWESMSPNEEKAIPAWMRRSLKRIRRLLERHHSEVFWAKAQEILGPRQKPVKP